MWINMIFRQYPSRICSINVINVKWNVLLLKKSNRFGDDDGNNTEQKDVDGKTFNVLKELFCI